MKLLSLRRTETLALAAIALLVLGCSDNSTQPKAPKPRYPEATTKEIVIGNLLNSYADRNIDQFAKLLHDDYIWYNQARDVVSGGLPEYYTRSEDIAITRNMFLAALHTHPTSSLWLDKLELKIYPGTWEQIIQFEEVPCEDCWETTRPYELTLMTAGGALIYIANDLVRFIVVPVDVNGKKLYRIIRCDDIES